MALPVDPQLKIKSQLLRDAPLFGTSVAEEPHIQKHNIFLALAGLKPVSEASSGHFVSTSNGRRLVPDDPAEVTLLLHQLGLHWRITRKPYYLLVQVSLSEECLEQYEAAGELSAEEAYRETGSLFGYPKTAVEAFVAAQTTDRDPRLPRPEQDAIERAAGIPETADIDFWFSRDHWREELPVVKEWCRVLRQYGFLTPPA